MKLLEGSALYVLGGVTVIGMVAAFGAGIIGTVVVCAKTGIDFTKYKDKKEETEDSVTERG